MFPDDANHDLAREAVQQFYNELSSLIQRTAQESDITIVEVVGVLEITKQNVFKHMETNNQDEDDNNFLEN